jgi:hypothetical protein
MYTRVVPDEGGILVHTTLVLDLERHPDVCSDIGCFLDHAADSETLHSCCSDIRQNLT